MKILRFLKGEKTEKFEVENITTSTPDSYQASLNQMGKEQFVSLLNRGLRVPIALL